MAAPTKPQKVTANGKDSWWFVPAIASPAAPTAVEINAVGGINISCYLLAEQEGVTSNAEKVRLARLLCETTTTEGLGEQTWSLADLQAVFDPQGASGSDGKKAWEQLKDGATGFLVRRQGVVALTDGSATTGQFVDVFPVTTGKGTPGKSANDAAGIYTFIAPVALTDTPTFNVAVA